MSNYNENQESPYDLTKLAFNSFLRPEKDCLSKFAHYFKKTVPFEVMLHVTDEMNIVISVEFDLRILFTLKPVQSRKNQRRTEKQFQIL